MAKKLRKAVKALKAELAAFAVRKPRRKTAARKPAVKLPTAPAATPVIIVAPAVESTPPMDTPPASPAN